MPKPLVIVTGANGQLGKELKRVADRDDAHQYQFFGKDDLPIHHAEMLRRVFDAEHPAYCINCAAYTAVDKAETERDLAMLVNGQAPGTLAEICHAYGTRLVHLSTDYVFDGKATAPYAEQSETRPVNHYGATKREGEQRIMEKNPDAMIIRTSWLYSEYGKNFVKTMVTLMADKPSLNVVDDQWGSPTYAADLAEDIVAIIRSGQWHPGLYHYSNEGAITWYEFARAIQEKMGSTCEVHPISTEQYPTPAHRPAYSVMSKEKFTRTWGIAMRPWTQSLDHCLARLGVLKS